MRLAKLTLAGFKSFADKTEIRFDQPLVGIVGPNGCGKSNVVDALKWVLGEQSAKSLRGGAMMDVIFNGSASRKPSGMASVTMTFENPVVDESRVEMPDGEDVGDESLNSSVHEGTALLPHSRLATRNSRLLPIDADEVAVTRNLYRDGTSEYLINGKRTRLRDVRELFLDTGIGNDAYSIIEQGRVARMLEANPDERRQIFEEAAGIAKFKQRKKEALRKLERTQQNLALVRTRLEETQRRLRSVKAQATRARTWQEHTARLRELQLEHTLAEHHRLTMSLAEIASALEEAEADRDRAARSLAEAEAALADADLERQAAAGRLKSLEHTRLETRGQADAARQRGRFATSALEDLDKQEAKDRQRADELDARSTQIERDLESQRDAVEDLTRRRDAADAELTAARERHRAMQHALNEARSRLDDERAGVNTLLRRTAQLQHEVKSLENAQRSLATQRDRLEGRSGELASELEALLTNRDAAREKLGRTEAVLTDEGRQLEGQQGRAAGYDEQIRDVTARLTANKEQRSAWEARRATLQEMEDRLEGVNDAVKAVLARAQTEDENDRTFGFVRGLLAELIDADVEHAGAVEAALGEHQQALVVDRLGDLCGGVQTAEALRSLAGRVAFVPIQIEPARAEAASAAESAGSSHAEAPAAEAASAGGLFDQVRAVGLRPFFRDERGKEFFDGCLHDTRQGRLKYRYVLTQCRRHGICDRPEDYPHTRVVVECERAICRAVELGAFMEGVPYPRYRNHRGGA